MATYKSEFLHHHYKRRAAARLALHHGLAAAAVRGWPPAMPRLVNALTSSRLRPGRSNGSAASPRERDAPPLRRPDLPDLVPRAAHRRATGAAGRCCCGSTPSTTTSRPDVLQAGVAVLENAGYRVRVPDGTQCCGLTWITTGQLGVARRIARRTTAALAPAVARASRSSAWSRAAPRRSRATCPNSSTATTDARALRPRPPVTLAELLVHHAPDWQPPRIDGPLDQPDPLPPARHLGLRRRQRAAGTAWASTTPRLDSGCCGLAGNFGFERGHYDVSVAAGEQVLLPAVRAADPDTAILADGFSCRTQIAQQTDRARHPPRRADRPALPPTDTST